LKILGSGFCAIASPRSTSSMPFLVMALAALTLLGRRRKQ
jgi:MYXO-CTERM domain-containing protein